MRSERSTVRTCERRMSAASASWASRWAASSRARRMRNALSLFCSWLFSFWQLTTMPLGMCVRRTAESVVLTDWPPGPDEWNTSTRTSLGSISISATSSASGKTRTPAADVWMRP